MFVLLPFTCLVIVPLKIFTLTHKKNIRLLSLFDLIRVLVSWHTADVRRLGVVHANDRIDLHVLIFD